MGDASPGELIPSEEGQLDPHTTPDMLGQAPEKLVASPSEGPRPEFPRKDRPGGDGDGEGEQMRWGGPGPFQIAGGGIQTAIRTGHGPPDPLPHG